MMKLLFATLLIASMVLSSSFLQTTIAQAPAPAPAYPTPSYNCSSKCTDRCAAAGYKKRCMNCCKICCNECKCVPSGTVGNKSECPCYRDKLNSKGKSKCP